MFARKANDTRKDTRNFHEYPALPNYGSTPCSHVPFIYRTGVDQGAFEMQPEQRAKPTSNAAVTTSTQVSASVFCGIMLLPLDGRIRADAPSRETEPSLSHAGDMCLRFFCFA